MTGSLINKRNKIYAVLNIYDEIGKRHRKWIPTELTAKSGKKERDKVLRDIIAQYENAPQVATTKLLFSDYVKVWLNEAKIKVDKVTYQHYENDANNHIIPYFEYHKTKLVDVTRQILQNYFNQKHESGNLKTGGGLSAKSLRHHKNIIHQTLELAVLNNYIAENPCKSLTLPKLERNVYEFFTLEETQAFLQAVKNERLYPLYYLTAVYGLRRSEVLGLKWESVDLKGKKLIIKHTRTRANEVIEKDKTKTRSSLRSFPLTEDITNLLVKLHNEEKHNKKLFGKMYIQNDYIFKWENGKPYNPDYITSRFSNDLKKFGFKHIAFHGLRHSCGSLLNEQGFTLKDIQEWLGHSDIQTTANIYLHLDIKRKENIANSLANSLKV